MKTSYPLHSASKIVLLLAFLVSNAVVESLTPLTASSRAIRSSSVLSATTVAAPNGATASSAVGAPLLVNRVAVVGATGRTGRYVVQELLDRGAQEVVALVRSQSKAQSVFSGEEDPSFRLDDMNNGKLKFVECDLTNARSIEQALQGMEAAIWCATGFSSNQNNSVMDKVRSLVGIATKQSIDLVGLPKIATILESNNANGNNKQLPKVVMCSSAGVTRPSWSADKKKRLVGAAEIPIVRLNPFGILDVKRESEEILRQTKVPYCIVRPAGLNDSWPAGSRPIVSQGDVAVGRINRKDVASLLIDMLSELDSVGKTFEVMALANYPKPAPSAVTKSLQGLASDDQGELPMETIVATYTAMQQLLPGEKQDSAGLAMGQTYEQLDNDQTGRLGKRGQEDFESVAPKPSNN